MVVCETGYATICGPLGVKEFSTINCGHCNRIVCVSTSSNSCCAEEFGHCRVCDSDICTTCIDRTQHFGCEPFLAKLEVEANRARFLKVVTDG